MTVCNIIKGGHINFVKFVSPQITNQQILGLIPQSHICKFLRYASPQILKFVMLDPQIENQQNSMVSKSANRKSAKIYGPQIANPQTATFAELPQI
jgi:hypothetical protein